jgi:hypothetical protein
MSRVAYCVLEIFREQSSPGRRRCTRCRIANDPPELPDGAYRVEFARYSGSLNPGRPEPPGDPAQSPESVRAVVSRKLS